MELERIIEVYRKSDECNIGTYVIKLDTKGLLNELKDLILKEDDDPK